MRWIYDKYYMGYIIENYRKLFEKIKDISLSEGRDPEEIRIIAVSKTFSSEIVQQAIDDGLSIFGENKIQEARHKIAELKGKFSFHLVGHLQSNKAKEAVRLFDLVHSIDKESTADKLNEEAIKINKIQKILVQVNTSGESTKSGIMPEETPEFIKNLFSFNNLKLLGLMTIGPFTGNEDEIRNSFRLLKELLNDSNKKLGIDMKELSMGMSDDYHIAIKEGATMLRIGSAIFGNRDYPA